MRSPASSLLFVLGVFAASASAEQTVTQSVQVRVHFDSRTSLTVSSSVLEFEHVDPQSPSTVTIDFTARARTQAGGQVVMTVESVRAIEGPGGAADVDASLSFSGEGEGALSGAVSTGPSIAARWIGSGARDGRLSFVLRAPAPGRYTVPLRFVLTAP